MTNFDQRLRDAGISTDDVETQIQSADTALLLTAREIVLLEPQRVQRGRLRDITGVKIVKTGELSVRSAAESMIEGNVLGFEKTERKLFFDAVKDATARAKAGVTNATLPPTLASPESLDVAASHTSADDWRALTSASPSQQADFPSNGASVGADFGALPSHGADFGASPSHGADPDPFTVQPIAAAHLAVPSAPDFAPNVSPWGGAPGADAPNADSPDAGDDPWKASKQTFEVEPEKPVSPADPWLATSAEAPSDSAPAGHADSWNDPFAAGAAVGVAPLANVTAVQTGNDDWGGDMLEAGKALSGPVQSDLERRVSVATGDNTSTLQALSRWLKIFAVVFFLSGAAFTVTLLPADASNILGYLVLLSAFFGSVLFSLIAWGLGELLSAYAISMQDLKAIRRATLGH